MPTNKFYNRLSELIPLSNLPGELMRLEDYLEPIYGSLYYRKLQQQGSLTQGKAFYQLDLITYQPISLGIPGLDEMELLILPDEDGNGSSLPVSLSYELPILRYLQNFNITQFDFRRDYFYLLQSFAGLSSSSFLITTAGRQFPQSADFLQDWVSQYNDDNTQTIYPNYDEDEIIYGQNIVGELQNNNINPIEYLLDNYWSTLERQDMLEGFSSAFYERLGDTNETSIKELFSPRINAAIRQTPIGLRIPSFIFREWDDNNQKPKEDANGDDIPTMLTFNSGQINYNSQDAGLSFIPDGSLSFPKSEILKTGFTLEVNDLQVDLKEETDIAEVKEAGYPPYFKGVFIQSATIGLPPFLIPDGTPPEIKGENLIIGTGGFSGKLTLDAGGQLKLGSNDGFSMGLDAFSLNFQQNSITDSAIKGWLKIPGFKQQGSTEDAKIGIEASFENNGDFHITADQNNGLQIIEVPDVMKININSLEVGREDNDYFIALSGTIDLVADVPGLGEILPKGIEVQKLLVWQDGTLELEGGGLTLPSSVNLQAGPVDFSVTGIHLGSTQTDGRQYRYIGFDGGIGIDPGGVDAQGDGIKYFYTTDGGEFDHFLRVAGIGIDLIIPSDATEADAILILNGYLAVRNPENGSGSTEYMGNVEFALPQAGMGGGASMRLNPDKPSFIIDAGPVTNRFKLAA